MIFNIELNGLLVSNLYLLYAGIKLRASISYIIVTDMYRVSLGKKYQIDIQQVPHGNGKALYQIIVDGNKYHQTENSNPMQNSQSLVNIICQL